MLATGQSIIAVFNRLMERGSKKEIHIAVVIAPEGIAHLENTCLILAIFGLPLTTN
jgi:uracil phosphoribosyltransferase